MKTARKKVTRELLEAVNTRLAPNFEAVKKAGSARGRQQLGSYYLVNTRINGVCRYDVDVHALADELGVSS